MHLQYMFMQTNAQRFTCRQGDVTMTLDPVLLSRMQFAWLIAWHILLPAFTVGLASYIAFVEGLYFFRK